MRKAALTAVALAVLSLGMAGPAHAVIGTVEPVPAASLLLPYFEVDLSNPNGATTLFSINNASATAVLAHVTLWSDLSVPTFAFNVYLTGYDVQTINIRDIFNGLAPQTASAGQDFGDTISHHGILSQDINFASCFGILPPPPIPAFYLAHLAAAHTGKPSAVLGGLCSGQALGDNVARGYVTVDTVNNCTLRAAGDIGYFGFGGTGDVTNQNILWGEVFYVNPTQNVAEGDTLVHIEAAPGVGVGGPTPSDPATTTPGRYTFYGRYDNSPWTATDNREPLATNFGARFLNGGAFTGGTSLLVWRDPKVNQHPFTCPAVPGARPPWYPLGQEGIAIFDEQEHPVLPVIFPFFPPPPMPSLIPFPAATQRTQVGGASLPVPFPFGWLYLNMNTTVAAAGSNPPVDPAASQAWVMMAHASNGRFGVGYAGARFDSATAALHFNPIF